MKAWYLNKNTAHKTYVDDSITFFLYNLLTDELNMSCALSGIFDEYSKRGSLDDKSLIEIFFNTAPPSHDSMTKVEVLQSMKYVRQVKAKKNKSRDDLRMILDTQKVKEGFRKYVLLDFDVRFEEAGMLSWKNLPQPGKVNMLPFYDEQCEEKKRNDYYTNLIKNCILSKTDFHVFNMNAFHGMQLFAYGRKLKEDSIDSGKAAGKKKNKTKIKSKIFLSRVLLVVLTAIALIPYTIYSMIFYKKTKKLIEKEQAIAESTQESYSIQLFRMPISKSLEEDKVKMINNHLQEKIKILAGKLCEFKSAISNSVFDENIPKKTKNFFIKIEPDLKKLQSQIDNELYLQQLVHSNEKNIYYAAKAMIASIDQITRLYERNGILLPYVAEALRKNLSMQMDINKCDLILFWFLDEYA